MSYPRGLHEARFKTSRHLGALFLTLGDKAGAAVFTWACRVDLAIAFQSVLAHGVCVGVRFPDSSTVDLDLASGLSPMEQRHARGLPGPRQASFVAGRMAMRAALARLGVHAAEILVNDRGAPLMPAGVVGSISHKHNLAVAMATRDRGWTVGVDIEKRAPSAHDIAKRVLTQAERHAVASLAVDGDDEKRGLAVMLRFSLKEAIYKAIDPMVRRYVKFAEVEVEPGAEGTARVRHTLEQAIDIEARWLVRDGYFLTSARARPGQTHS